MNLYLASFPQTTISKHVVLATSEAHAKDIMATCFAGYNCEILLLTDCLDVAQAFRIE